MKHILLFSLLLSAFQAHAEQILKRSNDAEPSTLDPQLAQGMPEMHILRDLFVGLIDEDNQAKLIPGAAESWAISEDGKIYTFKLRQNALWSDGKPVTAHDFVYAWQRAVNPEIGSKYAFFLDPIKNAKEINANEIKDLNQLGVKALDDYTLQVELKHSTPYFLGMLVNAVTYPVPKHIVEKNKDWTNPKNMVSNGAFKLKEWQPQVNVVLEKSPHYYEQEKVKLDKVIYYITEDRNTELKRYRAGEIDLTSEVPNDQIKWLKENLKDELSIYNYLGTYYYGFNLTKEPFKDNPKLREALTLVIDREKIVEHITASGEKPAYGYVVPEISNYSAYVPEYASWDKEKRLKRAQELYAEAGYSKEKPFNVELLYNTNENNKRISVAVASMWKEALGVEVNLINKEWKAYLADRREYKTQIFRGSWIGDYDDANTFLDMFKSDSTSNTIGLKNPEYDQLIEQASLENDLVKRAEILQQAEKHLIDNWNLIPIHYFVSKRLVKPYVKGYQPNLMNHWQSKYLYLENK